MNETTNVPTTPVAVPWRLPLGRRGLLLAAMALIGAGLFFNWGWLTAVGAAPLILSLAPCAVMCGLGLCMMGGSKSCASKTNPAGEPEVTKD
ncbi:hypothetical protein [uncultured Jannaschia sp.]|uniref:hypothetical protein n=1 Tax=uncultured Jannaschia sp. TaxID=293347 RepID=UPI0026233EBA|nr:hypothetical protein [uncultured Jannaschia sp.]